MMTLGYRHWTSSFIPKYVTGSAFDSTPCRNVDRADRLEDRRLVYEATITTTCAVFSCANKTQTCTMSSATVIVCNAILGGSGLVNVPNYIVEDPRAKWIQHPDC